MRYITVFCGRYSLETGTRFVAWFNIVLYLMNIILNITSVEAVKSYRDNIDEHIDYDEDKLLAFNYICLTFGVVTILLSTAFLVKYSESEDFIHFMIRWNVVRCIFVFAAIIYVTVDMDHIITVALSSVLITVDLCASTYFTGVMASYVKQLEDPNWQVHSSQPDKTAEPSIHLVSHKKSLPTEKVSYFNEVAYTASPSFVDVSLDDEEPGEVVTEDHNSTATANDRIKSALATKGPSSKVFGESGDGNEISSNEESPLEEKSTEEKLALDSVNQNLTSSEGMTVPTVENSETETEKHSENEETKNILEKEKDANENGVANVAFDAGETDPPTVVLIPASPVENADLNGNTNERGEDKAGEENPAFEQVDADETT
ncbi:uncharacterized protein LOC114525270 [Dendronephthya gigantea]|uniref:uncharacterized protein LOC114525270 n=1 Tax=Dendronephthya gigantea TaxID=151771 RepID=UPI00106A0FF7|nr:uncharacterized protein LOC114525270 [Dendronephthya gigantea]XP_028402307.1 uncharacterized protein LOC114525270 [Dendronephthya gigantea]XP_028402308.1 uncharacterized protein LOC114525270 [Dendronephthya gigantea]XP_028402309.1 uncharacterized protein LOC114525270 [Dendronephthya gigantea]